MRVDRLLMLVLLVANVGCPSAPVEAVVPPTTTDVVNVEPKVAATPDPIAEIATAEVPTAEIAVVEPDSPQAASPPVDVYSGTHKLGVNRVTDMARTGSVTFSRKDGALRLEGRVERGRHWLALSGTVQPDGPDTFVLVGTIEGVPDMAWNGEAPRQRRTEGRFKFEIKKRRPYWRLYEVDGKDCVCWENCGNDFCYIDIERAPTDE